MKKKIINSEDRSYFYMGVVIIILLIIITTLYFLKYDKYSEHTERTFTNLDFLTSINSLQTDVYSNFYPFELGVNKSEPGFYSVEQATNNSITFVFNEATNLSFSFNAYQWFISLSNDGINSFYEPLIPWLNTPNGIGPNQNTYYATLDFNYFNVNFKFFRFIVRPTFGNPNLALNNIVIYRHS